MSKNRNIVMLARRFWPHRGGVEKHVLEVGKRLVAKGNKVTVITEQYDPILPLLAEREGIKIYRLPYSSLATKWGVWQAMKQSQNIWLRADVLQVHDVFWWLIPWVVLGKVHYSITFHGYEGCGPPPVRVRWFRQWGEGQARGSMAVGEFMKKWYGATPEIVTYGAAVMKQKPQIRNKRCVFWGRFDRDTGAVEYVKAMAKLPKEYSLVMYGQGPDEVKLAEMVTSLGLTKRVKLHPWKDGIETEVAKARFAFVSRYLSILEAMQMKRLVAAVYNNQIKADYLRCHPAYEQMVVASGADELAEKLLLTEEETIEKVAKAYLWAKTQTWEKLVSQYEALWQK